MRLWDHMEVKIGVESYQIKYDSSIKCFISNLNLNFNSPPKFSTNEMSSPNLLESLMNGLKYDAIEFDLEVNHMDPPDFG